jgi:transcriptional regulator with XRE-family HTH domain
LTLNVTQDNHPHMITPEQSRAARGLLEWSQERLASEAQVARQTVVDFERGERVPTDRSLNSMQNAFEAARVKFSESKRGGRGVTLLPSIWKLKPMNPKSINWKASIYCGEVVIRATSEREARSIATRAFAIAVRRAGQTIHNPWGRMIDEATCERLTSSQFPEDGCDEILEPADFDHEWRR